MGMLRVIAGTPGSARESAIDSFFAENARAILVTPTQAYAAKRREHFLQTHSGPGFLGQRILPFKGFIEKLLVTERILPRTLHELERRRLLQECIEEVLAQDTANALPAGIRLPGFAAHLLRMINDMKQAAVEPDDFITALTRDGEATDFERVVAAVYAEYQQALKVRQAFDISGLYWMAYELLADRAPEMLKRVELLAFDGFDDFTPSELRVVEAAARHVPEVVIGLNHDDRPDRADVFVLSQRTLAALRHVGAVTHEQVPPSEVHTAQDYAAAKVFWRDRPGPPPDGLAGELVLRPCQDTRHEVETIGREIKTLLLEHNARSSSIAVAFPDISRIARLLNEVFSEFQIPIAPGLTVPAAQTSLGGFLLQLIEAMRAWEQRPVVDVLMSGRIPGLLPGAGQRDAAGAIACMAQVTAGKEEWHQRLGALAQHLQQDSGRRTFSPKLRMPGLREAVLSLQSAVAALADAAEELPTIGRPQEHALAFASLLARLQVEESLADATEDQQAWRAAQGVLEMLSTGNTEISREEFFEALEDGLRIMTIPLCGTAGGVVCVEVESLRNLTFDYVFIGGMTEGALPAPTPLNALYNEHDIARLAKQGIPIGGRFEHSARERLIFYHALRSSTIKLHISWPQLKQDGREGMRSPFVVELDELFAEKHVMAACPTADAFIPQCADAASVRDIQLIGMHRLPQLRGQFPERFAYINRGVEINARRNSGLPCDSHDGVLDDPELVAKLEAQFGSGHIFSVNQLEMYRKCAFDFFVQRVLRVDELAPADGEMDPRVRGMALHSALEQFHRRYCRVAIAEIPQAEAAAAMRECVAEAFDHLARRQQVATVGVIAVEEQRMQEALSRYLNIERRKARGDVEHIWRPHYFEVAFGRQTGQSQDALSREEPFAFNTGREQILFAGRIDRIDLRDDEARLIDYKTKTLPAGGDILNGIALQLSVYANAVSQHLLPNIKCADGMYLEPGTTNCRKGFEYNRKPIRDWEQTARTAVQTAVDGIRSGNFAPVPHVKPCHGCGSAGVCRFEKSRMERKGLAPSGGGEESDES